MMISSALTYRYMECKRQQKTTLFHKFNILRKNKKQYKGGVKTE